MKSKSRVVKKSIFVFSILLSSILIGLFIGNSFVVNLRNKLESSYNIADFQENLSEFDFSNITSPDTTLASRAYIYATNLLSQKSCYRIYGDGVVKIENGFLGELKLWGNAEKNDDLIKTSIVAYNHLLANYRIGLKYDYNINNDLIDFYYGKSNSDGSAVWGKPESITSEEYFEEWGLAPSEFFTYTISGLTALTNSKPTTFVDENGETLYRFEMHLDPITSTINYKKQLHKMSGLSTPPTFKEIKFCFVVDKDYEFRLVEIEEIWNVYFGFMLNCKSTISYNFAY